MICVLVYKYIIFPLKSLKKNLGQAESLKPVKFFSAIQIFSTKMENQFGIKKTVTAS